MSASRRFSTASVISSDIGLPLEDGANRIYVTVNPDYYDRSQSKAAPQHILIRLKVDVPFLNRQENGARHLESIQKLRETVLANLPEFRSMVK